MASQSVVWNRQDGDFHMYYQGWPDGGTHRIGGADSGDGYSWTRFGNNPLISPPSGWDHAETPRVFRTEAQDLTTEYYLIYELVEEEERRTIRITKSDDGHTGWTEIGTLIPGEIDQGKLPEPSSVYRDRDGTFNLIIAYPRITGKFRRLYTDDPEDIPWNLDDDVLDLGNEIHPYAEWRIDDLEVVPMGACYVGFYNDFFGSSSHPSHQPLHIVAGTKWKDLQYVGSALYPTKEIAEGNYWGSVHEAQLVPVPTEQGLEFRIYYTTPDSSNKDVIGVSHIPMGSKPSWPVVDVATLGAGNTTALSGCDEIPLHRVDSLNVSIELTYAAGATADPGARIHLRSSVDGYTYDSQDYTSFDVPLDAGATVRRTVNITPDPAYLKVLVENLTGSDITDLEVRAILG